MCTHVLMYSYTQLCKGQVGQNLYALALHCQQLYKNESAPLLPTSLCEMCLSNEAQTVKSKRYCIWAWLVSFNALLCNLSCDAYSKQKQVYTVHGDKSFHLFCTNNTLYYN